MSLQAHTSSLTRGWVAAIVLAAFSAASTQAIAQTEQQDLVNAAETTFSNFTRDPDMTWLQQHLLGIVPLDRSKRPADRQLRPEVLRAEREERVQQDR